MASGRRGYVNNQFRQRLNGLWCVYCGERANSDEHFPPASFTLHGVILPACTECNGMAGTAFTASFADRCQYVREKIEKKYRKVLDCPEWDEEELSSIGYGLRVGIKKWEALRKEVRRRLNWDPPAYLACIDRGRLLVPADERMQRIVERQKALVRMKREKAA